jgi:hypothetical protein
MILGRKVFNQDTTLRVVFHSALLRFILFSTILFSITFNSVEVFAQQNRYNAVIFWYGVNGKPFSSNKFWWREDVDNLIKLLSEYENEYADPFEIKANKKINTAELFTELQNYLLKCKDFGKKPFIVFIPRLNIIEYVLSFFSFPIPYAYYPQNIINSDINWIKSLSPIIDKVNSFGYEIKGLASSWGVHLAYISIGNSIAGVSSLISINGRTHSRNLKYLEEHNKVQFYIRICTSNDAYTYSGKAAFCDGKEDIFITNIDGPNWGNPIKNHTSIFTNQTNSNVTFYSDEKKYEMHLGKLIRNAEQFHNNQVKDNRKNKQEVNKKDDLIIPINDETDYDDITKKFPPPPPPPDQPIPIYTGGIQTTSADVINEKGVSMKMEIDSTMMAKDESDSLNQLKNNILRTKPRTDSLLWHEDKDSIK